MMAILFILVWLSFLTAHNWQKWKGFLTCPCAKIYRVEAVGLKSSNYTLNKLRFLWICEIWGNFVKIWYFVNNYLRTTFLLKTMSLNDSFTLIENNLFPVFKIAKFEFKVTVHYGVQAKSTQLCPLNVW